MINFPPQLFIFWTRMKANVLGKREVQWSLNELINVYICKQFRLLICVCWKELTITSLSLQKILHKLLPFYFKINTAVPFQSQVQVVMRLILVADKSISRKWNYYTCLACSRALGQGYLAAAYSRATSVNLQGFIHRIIF